MILPIFCVFIQTVASQLIDIPDFKTSEHGCVFPGIDPSFQVSKQAYQPRGRSQSCADLCGSETLFSCMAYTWAGPGSHCILHGPVNQPFLVPKVGSPYNLTDFKCSSGSATSAFALCVYEDRGISIAAPPQSKQSSRMTEAECRLGCDSDPFSSCSSYGFDPTAKSPQDTNCFLFSRNNKTTQLTAGPFRLYENRCRIKMVSCLRIEGFNI